MFSRCSQDDCRIFFQDNHFKWKIQMNSMISNYSMIPDIQWSPATRWSPAIRWSFGSMDFDNPKVYGDTSIIDGLVFFWRGDPTDLLVKVLIFVTDAGPQLKVSEWLTHSLITFLKGALGSAPAGFWGVRAVPGSWGTNYPLLEIR